METPTKILFDDEDFPAADSSLFSTYSTPIAKVCGKISWLRPQQICKSPRLFPANLREGHIKQGLLGDCWFLCACETLRKNRPLLDKVMPPGQDFWTQSGYSGGFRFHFWSFGHWVEVTIDDRLPCIGGRLCFSRHRSEEVFWLPLVEKAFAKFHGCYEQLWAGQVGEALVDITGSLAERWTLKNSRKNNEDRGHLDISERSKFELLKHLNDKSFISCSVHGSAEGGNDGAEFHAFSVTDVKQIDGLEAEDIRLLKIRNLWDRRCWNGSWQDGGDGWKKVDPAIASKLQSLAADGEFWVEEEEFFRDFDEVTIGYPINQEGNIISLLTGKSLCHSQVCPGAWIKGQTAGGCRNNSSFCSNPKFWLRIGNPCEVVVALLQKPQIFSSSWTEAIAAHCHDNREDSWPDMPQKCFQAIGLHIWKVEKRRFHLQKTVSKPPIMSTECHTYDREVKLHGVLSPGYYLLIPSTFMKDEAIEFLLRAFSSSKISLNAMKAAQPVTQCEESCEGEWEMTQFMDSWISGMNAGGSRNSPTYNTNPCFPFSILSDIGVKNVRITLLQDISDGQFLPIGFHVYQVHNNSSKPSSQTAFHLLEPTVSCIPHRYTKEVTQLCTLKPGKYNIVPSTYQPNCEASFTVSLETKIDRKPLQCQENLGQAIDELSYSSVMQR